MAKSERHHFLVVFLTGSLGLIFALSLFPTGKEHNLLGQVGRYLSDLLYLGVGVWAWIFPLVLFFFAASRFKKAPFSNPGLKIIGLIIGFSSLCVIARVFFHSKPLFPSDPDRNWASFGGKLGEYFGDKMVFVLTPFGTVVVSLILVVLSAWLLEKETHLVNALKSAWEGLARGANWFKENGFEALMNARDRAARALAERKARKQEEDAVADARQKFEKDEKIPPDDDLEERIAAQSRPQVVSRPVTTGVSSKPEKSSKPAVKSRSFFTGEAEALDESEDGSDGREEQDEEEEDLVAIAEAEAKAKDPMSLKQKMEAANIEIAETDEGTGTAGTIRDKEPSKPERVVRNWQKPTVHILKSVEEAKDKVVDDFEAISHTLKETLTNFGVDANVVGVNPGPTVTQYEVQPAAGVKITRIVSLADDLALALKCGQVRVVAPIPGKATVGIEVPNLKGRIVTLKELIGREEFTSSSKKLQVALGRDIAGEPIYAGIKEMPHMLIAGSTGSGKSVCVNAFIASLIFKYSPEELRLVLIDPKRVEMSIYRDLPHLALPVVNGFKEANQALKWLVEEMDERYGLLAHQGARDIDSYNAKILQKREAGETDQYPMYYIVVLVDELADLIITAKEQVEDSITRLAQMARAVGIHLVLATQRPSVEVITGIIKANFPSRIAFQVFSKVDSRTILDVNGAEALLGRGDMLYLPSGAPKPLRLQGAYVTLEEIERLVDFWKSQGGPPLLR